MNDLPIFTDSRLADNYVAKHRGLMVKHVGVVFVIAPIVYAAKRLFDGYKASQVINAAGKTFMNSIYAATVHTPISEKPITVGVDEPAKVKHSNIPAIESVFDTIRENEKSNPEFYKVA